MKFTKTFFQLASTSRDGVSPRWRPRLSEETGQEEKMQEVALHSEGGALPIQKEVKKNAFLPFFKDAFIGRKVFKRGRKYSYFFVDFTAS